MAPVVGDAPFPTRKSVAHLSNSFLRDQGAYCLTCNGYYGPCFSQPVCATCHAFLYANDLDQEINLQIMSAEEMDPDVDRDLMGPEGDGEDDSDRDSGNEEEPPTEDEAAGAAGAPPPQVVEAVDGEGDGGDEAPMAVGGDERNGGDPSDSEQDGAAGANEGAVGGHVAEPWEQQADLFRLQPVEAGDLRAAINVQNVQGPAVAHPFVPPMFAAHQAGPSLKFAAKRPVNVESLSDRLSLLSFHRPTACSVALAAGKPSFAGPSDAASVVPNEVWLVIFSFLDDISLYSVGNVCRRWHNLLRSTMSGDQWRVFTRKRWPLFRPLAVVKDWFATYSALVESCFCLTCIYQMAEIIPDDFQPLPLREKRLGHDLRGMLTDPPEGIKGQPLDSSEYHWQASITGPAGSPYEGGIFFLYLKVPLTYPFDPPEVRFLTRIFHPNVSRHGDVGIDSILKHNWVSGLTIPKVLISIQSLLTDPYCQVCMEPEIGRLYRQDRAMFDAVARSWTWRFAMHDAIPPRPRA